MEAGSALSSRPECTRERLIQILDRGEIVPHFQPIVDLYSCEVMGYEVLARGPEPYPTPALMFGAASGWGLESRLDRACREAALAHIGSLQGPVRNKKFFINASPALFADRGAQNGFHAGDLASRGLHQSSIVIEVNEKTTVDDYGVFEAMIRHNVEQGFSVALDDFGAGHSGLTTLVAMTPHFIKLDRALVAEIDSHSLRQRLVRSIVTFASAVDIAVVAEGIEREEEVETLFRLGVRYGQGFLFGRPAVEPSGLVPAVEALIVRLVRRYDLPGLGQAARAFSLATRPYTCARNTMSCEALDGVFKSTPSLDHVVVLDERRFVGLVTRQGFYARLGGRFGYSVFQHRDVSEICQADALLVGEGIELSSLGNLAMGRSREELYDPVGVVDPGGAFVGTITMKQLLGAVIEQEVRAATALNPLTRLPGNTSVLSWLKEALADPPFGVVYADLDNFKGYNDAYGFARGDEMIELAAEVLSSRLRTLSASARLGHIGGDDYVIVVFGAMAEEALAAMCAEFDRRKLALFSPEDARRGYFVAKDRKGELVEMPLVTLSLAALSEVNLAPIPHPAAIAQMAASLKGTIKAANAARRSSGYLVDRRRHEQP